MKHVLTAVLALSLLDGTAVLAQPNNPNRAGQSDNRDQRDRNDQNRNDQGRDQGRGNNPNVRAANPRWSRGDRLPEQYRQDQYAVSDWRQHGLRQPPRGYRWVRNDNNDFFLAAISTGLIAELAYRDDRDQRWRQTYTLSLIHI